MINKLSIITAVLLLTSSCKTDFSVSGEHDETPVVHFLIDPSDEYHFMKINKTFLGDGNANEFANVKDSSHFNKVEAVVKQIDKNTSNVVQEWELKDTIIDNKEPGVFYNPEEKLYYFKAANLDNSGNYIYRLEAVIEDGKHEVFGETELVEGIVINSPGTNNAFRFANSPSAEERYVNSSIRYSPGNAVAFNTRLIIKYNEVTSSGNEQKSITWNLGDVKREDFSGPNVSALARGEAFYRFVADNIEVNPDVIRRTFTGFEIVITGGSEDLNTYMTVAQPSTSIAQNQPEFSNIEGGRGIFSSRLTVINIKTESDANIARALSTQSTRELCNGVYTIDLDFCSPLVQDNGTDFSCN